MPAANLAEPIAQQRDADYRRISLLSLGHLMNDLYGNLMTSLTPYLVVRGVISVTTAGLVLLVYLIGSSVLQPLFGILSDRSGRRLFAVAGPLWVGAAAALFGWAGSPAALLALAAFGGIGTAAFHPQAASMVNGLNQRSKGFSMSIFSMGGNIGFACGPAVAAAIAVAGLHWSIALIVPGIGLTALLALFAPHTQSLAAPPPARSIGEITSGRRLRLSLVIAVIAVRSGVQYGMIIFMPLYFHARGYPTQLGSYYAFVLSLAGAFGGLLGGHLSDLYGRRIVVVASLVISAPLLLASFLAPPAAVWPIVAVAGATLIASNSVTVVQGQELLPDNTGIASGLTMGLGFGFSGILTSSLATFSDHAGVAKTIYVVPVLALVAAALAVFIPDARRTPQAAPHLSRRAGAAQESP